MIMQETVDITQVCPKCGSPMEIRKIWKKFKSVDVPMCKACRFYLRNPDENSLN